MNVVRKITLRLSIILLVVIIAVSILSEFRVVMVTCPMPPSHHSMISVIGWGVARFVFIPAREEVSAHMFADPKGIPDGWRRNMLSWNGDESIGTFEVTISLWMVAAILVVINWLIIRSGRKPHNAQS